MITITVVKSLRALVLTSWASVCFSAFLLTSSDAEAQTYDPVPTPYCTISFVDSSTYLALESQATGTNPEAKVMAQFVLEAFALANANKGLLDSQSQSSVVTVLNRLQSIWVPTAVNFKWNYTDTTVTDDDAVEFVTESLVQIAYRFPNLLAQYGPVSQSGTIENLLATLLTEGQQGELNHTPSVRDTNIWLLKNCNLTLLGQGVVDGSGNVLAPSDADITNAARTNLLDWVTAVQTNGIHEFMSPTYTGVQLEALGYIFLYSTDPGIQTIAQQGWKLIWTDMYASWFYQDQRIGGTHSRTYEFLLDEDHETDRFYWAVSHLAEPPTPAWPQLLVNRPQPGYWHGQDFISYYVMPPSDVPYLFPAQVPVNSSTTILRNFGDSEDEYDDFYEYAETFMANPQAAGGLSYPYSIGSAEALYDNPNFEGWTIMMPGNGTTANVNYNMQGREDYYLENSTAGGLIPFIASVQNDAETIFLAASNGQADAALGASEVASTITIPNTAQVWIGNSSSPVSLGVGQSESVAAGESIFITMTNPGESDCLATGIRFLLSTDMGGNTIGLSLVNDGSQYNALRITCEHISGTPSTGNAVIAYWSRTAYCTDITTNFNTFRTALTSPAVTNTYDPASGNVNLSVPGLNGIMSIQANAANQTTTSLSGSDLDAAPTLPLLNVNGTEYVLNTLQTWASEDIGDASGGSSTQLTTDGLYDGQVEVSGGGGDIWGRSDGFHFYYQQLVGNGTVIARLTNMPSGTGISAWAKAGVMMRNDLTPGSPNALVSLDDTKGQRFSYRTAENGESTRSGNSNTTSPYWFKLTRVGNTFTGYSSPDGVTWTQVGSPVTITMNHQIYVGLAVTSDNEPNNLQVVFERIGNLQQ
jgi:hypothetical protein